MSENRENSPTVRDTRPHLHLSTRVQLKPSLVLRRAANPYLSGVFECIVGLMHGILDAHTE